MTYSDYSKMLKQIGNKPAKLIRYKKFNTPKAKKYGRWHKVCKRCGNVNGHVGKYNLKVCRQCFREIATKIGFKKYS